MNTRRILLLAEYGWGGVNTMTQTLTDALTAQGWQVTTLQWQQVSWSALIEAAKQHDVIVATHNFGPTYCGVVLKLFTGKPLVSWVHGPVLDVLREAKASIFKKWGLKLFYKLVTQFVCVSHTTQNSLLKVIRLHKKQRSEVILNGLGELPPGPVIHIHAGTMLQDLTTVFIGYVGRLSSEKRPQLLMDTIRLLPKEVELGIVGDGPMRSDILVDEMELLSQGRVHLLGRRPCSQSIYKLWRMTLLASRYEGCPMTALESLACGIPCVSLPIPAMRELYDTDAPYLLARGDSPADLAEAVLTVLNMPQAKVQADMLRIMQRHHIDDFVRKWQTVLHAC